VKARRYDIAILAAAPWRTAAAVAATRIPRRIGLRRRKNRFFLTDVLPDERADRPVLEEIARLLAPLGIEATALRYRLDASPLAERRRRFAGVLARPYAALHPFASKENRCVPLPVWIELSRTLASRGMSVLWIGSPNELNRLRTAPATSEWQFIDRVGDGTLADTAAALADAALFVGHDSGPLHVAGALGVPVVGIFAPGEPRRTFPQGVGKSRMLARPSPAGIAAADILAEIDAL
jgi:ADP-heptose:LPS heptosyltransferase